MSESDAGRREESAREPSTAGDLQFDEAWADAEPGDDAGRERNPRDEDPSFEDPNDR
jgi:hypothetical protein